ncbi:MAG: sulfatase-like hydrolase/transferase [Campylobacterota bacterium]|nr:sulfatase-like hydrolase/transferase [Campylobacterota bacterium]
MPLVRLLLKYYIAILSIFLVGRVALFALYFDRFKDDSVDYWMTFIYGLRMDIIFTSMLFVIPVLLLTLSPERLKNIVATFVKYYFLTAFATVIYLENATFPFFAQYDVRPNYLFVEYLEYPKEVFSMLVADYLFEFSIAAIMIAVAAVIYFKKTGDAFLHLFEVSYLKRAMLFLPLALLLLLGIRSSLGHRPANISDAMYSANRIVNEITKNTPYAIVYAIYANKKYGQGKSLDRYGEMEVPEALSRLKKRLNIQSSDTASPLRRLETSHFKAQSSKNLVIFLQESIGGQFVEAVGGEAGITPHFNRLAKEGILFKDLYSNGTRSIRGIAGVVSGNFSIPGKGVLKRNKSQADFFTLSSLLEPLDYKTLFLYGGESRFDNMKGWFLGNGFDEIIDEPKFNNPEFVGTWGVCDEEVAARANEEFKKLYEQNQKFAALMFSTSNHAPFDFPDGKFELIDGVEKKSVKNAIKYADFAIGMFIENARKEPYYKDTIFVVIADHNVRVYGDDVIPVNMFHVPGLILGDGVEPLVYDKISTQPDVMATALDLMGLDLEYPIMGHSIFSDAKQNLSLMQFNSTYGLRVDDTVAVLREGMKAQTFTYVNGHLVERESDVELEKDLLAFIVSLDYLYNKKLYK